MKIVLVFPPFYLESMYNLPPLGLLNLATVLGGIGHDVAILDFVLAIRQKKLKTDGNIYDNCCNRILTEEPDIVGFSAQCTTFPAVVQIARRLKEKKPDTKIVVGGHNASFVDKETLSKYGWIDCIVRGEGEETFGELVSSYEDGYDEEGIRGVTFRKGDSITRNEDRDLISNLDQLPFPNYRFLPSLFEYRDACGLSRSMAILEVGRGCPHRCVYCSESIFWRHKSRTFSVKRIVRDMKTLRDEYGAECFVLAYDQFTAKRSFVEEFCTKVIENGLNDVSWYCISRLDTVDPELLDLMKEAGCESMCFGIDSGSPRTLAFIRKQIDKKILYRRVEETTSRGIIPTLSFVIGFPEEEREDIDETLVLALRTGILGNNNPLIQMPTILPGTDLYARYAHCLVREVDTYFALGLEFDNGKRLPVDEELINSAPAIFCSFYNLPCKAMPLDKLNMITSYFPQIVNFYPKSFLLLSVETDRSVSQLFLDWLLWLSERLDRGTITLSSEDCYKHFEHFASETLDRMQGRVRWYIYDILRYETNSLDVARWDTGGDRVCLDVKNIEKYKPLKNRKIIVGEFEYNLPVIIADLKKGEVKDSYPPKKTTLVFKYENKQLCVTEINDFGRDFLELCNGDNALKEIAASLYPRYGAGLNTDEFYASCVEAVQSLAEMKYIAE